MGIGERIKETLANKGITPYKLSQETGLAQSTLTRMLRNDSTPNRSSVQLIAKVLEVNPEWLMTGEGNKHDFHDNTQVLNEPNTPYINDDVVADYIIENHERLMQNKKFAVWIRSVQLEAQHEVMKRSMEK